MVLTAYMLFKQGMWTMDQLNMVYNLGALGPLLGAVISARIFYGHAGVKKLFSTFSLRKLEWKSIRISFSPVLFLVFGLITYPLFKGHWYTFADTQRQFNLNTPISYVNWLLPFITYSILEEFGWRGFLLPHLQSRYTAIRSTAILTLIWASWHLPFFLWRFDFSILISIGFFFSIFVGAVIITSLFNLGRGNIVPVILFHFCNNISAALDKEYIVAVVSTGFVFLAIYLVRTYKPENLSDIGRIRNIYLENRHKQNDIGMASTWENMPKVR
jgi:membrane protease YdiL (CAAX protease family)